jgi:purine-cytosine permease-like protein
MTDSERAGRLEVHGIDVIPEGERVSRPSDFLWIWHSAQFSFGTVVLGALPVVFGLGWWASVTAITAGLVLGVALVAPVALFGLRTGTNDAIASGAHFGVKGRVVTNVITIGVGLGFFAITVWTGGTAVMVAGHRMFGTPTGSAALALTMPFVAVAVILVAVYGHATLIAMYKITAVAGGLVTLGLVLVLASQFCADYAGGDYALGGFWPTWLLSALVATSVPLSYATFQGDYSRYFPSGTKASKLLLCNGGSLLLSCLLALLAGAYVTTVFQDRTQPWVQSLTDSVPAWFAVVVIVFGFVGSFPQGSLCVYAAGLSANSIFWRKSRAFATILVSALGFVLLYAGTMVFDTVDSMAAFVTMLLVAVSPWAAVMIIGYRHHQGDYHPADLGTFATGGGGRYWYRNGYNPRALAAMALGVVVGVLSVGNAVYIGPIAQLLGGLDLSCLTSFAATAIAYAALNSRWSEVSDGRVPLPQQS